MAKFIMHMPVGKVTSNFSSLVFVVNMEFVF
jgi:hypothetical protein